MGIGLVTSASCRSAVGVLRSAETNDGVTRLASPSLLRGILPYTTCPRVGRLAFANHAVAKMVEAFLGNSGKPRSVLRAKVIVVPLKVSELAGTRP